MGGERMKAVQWVGNFGVASRVPSSISNFKMEHGTSLETLYESQDALPLATRMET